MFNARAVFLALNGKSFKFEEFYQALADIRLKHLGELPADMGVRELYALASQNGWLKEDRGQLRVNVA